MEFEVAVRPHQVNSMFLISLEPEIVSGRAQQKQTQAEKHKGIFETPGDLCICNWKLPSYEVVMKVAHDPY